MIDFVHESLRDIEARMIAEWERITGRTIRPASPERVLLGWFATGLAHAYEKINDAANQNTLSGATGERLDALAEMYGDFPRPQPQPAVAIMVFTLDEPQGSDVTIPQGTLVSDADGTAVFATNYARTIPAGETESGHIVAFCIQDGTAANGYAAGQINRFYGGFSGADGCRNVSQTYDGRDVMTDEEYRDYLRDKLKTFSVAGPRSGYESIVKGADERISDVCVVTPSAGNVDIYALYDNGITPATLAPSDMKARILAACSADTVRPLTDHVSVKDGTEQTYTIELEYYVRSDVTLSSAEISAVIGKALDEYKIWQAAKFGRDINPSKLTQMLMDTGLLTRVDITRPAYTSLNDGSEGGVPEHARCTGSLCINGGVEYA